MANGSSLINLGDLSKPATVLIEKISEAIGVIYEPTQIKRIAKAQVEANKIMAKGDIEINEIQKRALLRSINEETIRQKNIDNIILNAIPNINVNAKPENIEIDWISNFFDKCRIVSDSEMQNIWAQILANEANNPGLFSKRTVNKVGEIDKSDAILFTNLMRFNFHMGNAQPLIFNISDNIYKKAGLTFNSLIYLQDLGLINFDSLSNFSRDNMSEKFLVLYFDKPIIFRFKDKNRSMNIGKVLLSKIGQELSTIVKTEPIDGFIEFVIEYYGTQGIEIIVIKEGMSKKILEGVGGINISK